MMESVIILQYIVFIFVICFMPKPEVLSDINPDLRTVFDKTPKLWHHYIRKFLHRYLNYYVDSNKYSNQIIYFDQMFKYSSVFNNNKYKSVLSAGHQCAYKRDFRIVRVVCTKFFYRTSGTFYSIPFPNHQAIYSLWFNYVHSQMKPNVTFHTLFVVGQDELKVAYNYKVMYTFRGKYFRFNFFPKESNFGMQLTLQKKSVSMSDLCAVFSLMDKELVSFIDYTIQEDKGNDSNLLSYHYTYGELYKTDQFFIHCKKIFKIQLSVTIEAENQYVLHDGADSTFDILTKNRNGTFYITTTFQCLLLVSYNSSKSLSLLSKQNFSYRGIHHNIVLRKNIVPGSKVVQVLPLQECHGYLCLMKLETEKGYYFNVTVHMIKFSSKYTHCLLEGFSLLEELDKNYWPMFDFCYESFTPDVYTKTENLWLILYWHKKHKVTAKTLVSTTKCKGISISICFIIQACGFTLDDNSYCIDYIHSIPKYTDLSTRVLEKALHSDILVSFGSDTCYIFMVRGIDSLTGSKVTEFRALNSRCIAGILFSQKKRVKYISGLRYGSNMRVNILAEEYCKNNSTRCHGMYGETGAASLEMFNLKKKSTIDRVKTLYVTLEKDQWVNLLVYNNLSVSNRQHYSTIRYPVNATNKELHSIVAKSYMEDNVLGLDMLLTLPTRNADHTNPKRVFCSMHIERDLMITVANFRELSLGMYLLKATFPSD